MACDSELVPKYLHWNNQPVYADADFRDEHLMYRLGNPIAFPSTVTAYSCLWSFLINEKDLLETQEIKRYDSYRYSTVADIRAFTLTRQKDVDNSYLGWHKLTCFFEHSPTECVYAHSEINIKHRIFENDSEETLNQSFEYNHHNWKQAPLNGKSLWFKQFKADYITEIIKLFNNA